MNPYWKIFIIVLFNVSLCMLMENFIASKGIQAMCAMWGLLGSPMIGFFFYSIVYRLEIEKWEYLKEHEFNEFKNDFEETRRERAKMLKELEENKCK